MPWVWWESVFPSYTFPDESLDEAMNYCRNPNNGSGGPWCLWRNKKEEYFMNTPCPIPLCGMSDKLNDEYLKNAANSTTRTTAYDIAENIQLVFYPMIVIIGIITNLLSIAVFRRPSLRKSTTPFLLTLLAIADIWALLMGSFMSWLQLVTGLYLSASSDLSCQVYNYIGTSISSIPGWIIVIIIVEGIMGQACPFKANSLCTRKNAMYLVMLIFICSCFLNIPLILGGKAQHDIVFDANNEHFIVDASCGNTISASWWIDTFYRCVIPSTFMLVGNIILIILLIKAQNKRQSINVSSSNSHLHLLTILLLSASFAYLLLILPFMIYHLSYKYIKKRYSSFEEWRSDDRLFYICVCCAMYVNNAINFPLYCLSAKTFREEFKSMCEDYIRKLDTQNFQCFKVNHLNMTAVSCDQLSTPSPAVATITTNSGFQMNEIDQTDDVF